MGFSFKKIVKHAIAPVFSAPARLIEKGTGLDWRQQLQTGAAIGSVAGLGQMLRSRLGAIGTQGKGGGFSFDSEGNPISPGGNGFNLSGMLPSLLGFGSNIYAAREMASGAEDANAVGIASAREQMAFQERMSSTAHQREVEDLRRAGLNPALSAHGGASSPVGSSFEPVNEAPDYRGAIASAAEMARVGKELREADSRIRLNTSTAKLQDDQSDSAKELAARIRSERLGQDIENRKSFLDYEWDVNHPRQYWLRKMFQSVGPGVSAARDAALIYRGLKGFGAEGGPLSGRDSHDVRKGGNPWRRR